MDPEFGGKSVFQFYSRSSYGVKTGLAIIDDNLSIL